MPEVLTENTESQEVELDEVELTEAQAWRIEEALRLGYSEEVAHTLAHSRELLSIGDLRELVNAGASLETAARIVT